MIDILPLLQVGELDNTPVEYRIDDILTMRGNLLISAYRKTGKTSLILNLLASLTSQAKFLGAYPVIPLAGTVCYVNIELQQSLLRKYCVEMDIDPGGDRVLIQDYRGQISRFMVQEEGWRAEYADMLVEHKVKALVIDPIQPIIAMHGGDSNNNDEARTVMELLGEIANLADLHHLIVVDHTGHMDKTRARGASGKEDWADMLWNIRGADNSNDRQLLATGRAVSGSCEYTMNERKRLVSKPTKQDKTITLEGIIMRECRIGPRSVEELIPICNVTRERVGQVLRELHQMEQVTRVGKRGQAELWQATGF